MRQIDTIYDRAGNPVLRVFANGRLLAFDGTSVGFVFDGNVYDYNGSHRGWYEAGILRDHVGLCAGFGENVGNAPHPLLPLKRLKPFPARS